jgi:hypothetical protein
VLEASYRFKFPTKIEQLKPFRQFAAGLCLTSDREEWGADDVQKLTGRVEEGDLRPPPS